MKTATILTANDIKRLASVHAKLGVLLDSIKGDAPARRPRHKTRPARAAAAPKTAPKTARRPLANVETA